MGIFIGLLFCSGALLSQSTARISITKNHNGETEEISREIEIEEGQDLESILSETDIWQEFSNVKDGETYQINIVKINGGEEVQNLNIFLGDEFESRQKKAFLGVMLKEVKSEPQSGVLISEILKNTAAEKAGLRPGDIIAEIDGEEVTNIDEVTTAIKAKKPGDKIKVKYLRDGKPKKAKVELREKPLQMSTDRFHKRSLPRPPRPPHPNIEIIKEGDIPEVHIFTPDSAESPTFWNEKSAPFLGVTPANGKGEEGVKLSSVTQNSAAEKMGLKSGDVISKFNGNEINSFDQLARMISDTKAGSEVELTVIRDNEKLNISGEMGTRSFCEAKNYRMFRDYIGRDEDGAYRYEFQFDADSAALSEMQREIEKQIEEYNRQMDLYEKEMEKLNGEVEHSEMSIEIEIEDISDEEKNKINALANGKEELKNDNSLSFENIVFYPNPNDGEIQLEFETSEKGSQLEILIFNQNGKIVYRELSLEFDGSYQNKIDFSDEANGSYYIQIVLDDKVYSKKLIKN